MISFRNVGKVYNGTKVAVDDVTFDVLPGEIFGFLGPNGAGKSTTIKMVMGIVKPDSGTIEVNGKNIETEPMEAKQELGYVPDSPDMYLRLKGIEYINFLADVYGVPSEGRAGKIEKLSREFGMENALNDRIQSYSHGMRQKIVVIGALIHDPYAWVLDEPMTGLDPKSSFRLKEMMREHADGGNVVFFSTHVLDVAEKICDRIAIINHGKILYTGKVKDLEKDGTLSLENIFLEMTENE